MSYQLKTDDILREHVRLWKAGVPHRVARGSVPQANNTAFWPDEEDPLAQEHGFAKLQRTKLRMFAMLVIALRMQGKMEEVACIEQSMLESASRDIYGHKGWLDAQSWAEMHLNSVAQTARQRIEAGKA